MAARENFGLQVALIIFVILTLGLSVTTYMNYRAAEEAKNARRTALSSQKTAERARDTALFQRDYLKFTIGEGTLTRAELETMKAGVNADPEFEKIITKFDDDMDTYGEGLPETERNYASLPSHLIPTIQQKIKQVADFEKRETDLRLKVDTANSDAAAKIQVAVDKQKEFEQDLIKVRDGFEKDRGDFTSKLANTASQIGSLQKKITDVQTAASKQSEEQGKEINQLETLTDILKKRITDSHQENFEIPDGRIAWVDQKSNKVWLALGMADGLRPQITFSVYEKDENNIDKTNIKARVEVTRVVDENLSEARILEDTAADPILPGDVVYSPTWRPGRRIRFALIGMMDVDGDGKSDREFIRNLITMNGGVIDAELHDDGTPSGKMTVNTRYLVKGERPTESTENKVLVEYGRMDGAAQRLGIQEINLDELLSLMGWKPEVQTVPLGSKAREGQFRVRRPAGSSSAPANNGEAYE